ncbi:unnamed protein product [Aphanomyces euteiches]
MEEAHDVPFQDAQSEPNDSIDVISTEDMFSVQRQDAQAKRNATDDAGLMAEACNATQMDAAN